MFQAGCHRDYSFLEQELLEEYKSLPLSTVPYDQFEACARFPERVDR
jgi:hypothetical protein